MDHEKPGQQEASTPNTNQPGVLTPERIQEVLAKHKAFWRGEAGGQRADLRGADLRGADLRGAYLEGADLEGAYLEGAYLRGADLEGADLRGAYLEGADLEDGIQITGSVTGGWVRCYAWLAAETNKGLWLKFGCERRLATDWEENLRALCERHEPGHATYYEDAIRGILSLATHVLEVKEPTAEAT